MRLVQDGQPEDLSELSACEKVGRISSRVWETIKSDIKYPVCLLAAMITRLFAILFSVYMLLWVTSFVDSGVLESENEAKAIYTRMVVMSMIFTVCSLPLIGYMSDTAPSHITIPFTFGARALILFGFMSIKRPDTWLATFSASLIIVFTVMENVSVEVLYLRTMPRDVRGAMNGAFAFFGSIGALLFT